MAGEDMGDFLSDRFRSGTAYPSQSNRHAGMPPRVMGRADPQLLGAIARELSVDNRRDRDPNVPIRKPNGRPSINPSARLLKIRQNQFPLLRE